MECLCCKGTLVQKKVSYTATRRGYHLIIGDVPAWVCEQCEAARKLCALECKEE